MNKIKKKKERSAPTQKNKLRRKTMLRKAQKHPPRPDGDERAIGTTITTTTIGQFATDGRNGEGMANL
uniref:Uncharacterized protein n=1 Tax=Onchocerca volvulus TaxID=6282 RepID=A0A8R1Y602_ONCVO